MDHGILSYEAASFPCASDQQAGLRAAAGGNIARAHWLLFPHPRLTSCSAWKYPKNLINAATLDGVQMVRQPRLTSSWDQVQKVSPSQLPGHCCQLPGNPEEGCVRNVGLLQSWSEPGSKKSDIWPAQTSCLPSQRSQKAAGGWLPGQGAWWSRQEFVNYFILDMKNLENMGWDYPHWHLVMPTQLGPNRNVLKCYHPLSQSYCLPLSQMLPWIQQSFWL